MKELLAGVFAITASGVAIAGPATLGTPLGSALGTVLGVQLGLSLGIPLGQVALGSPLPIAGSGLLLVAASSLVIGIRMARKKRRR
jgi:hypothetical protein